MLPYYIPCYVSGCDLEVYKFYLYLGEKSRPRVRASLTELAEVDHVTPSCHIHDYGFISISWTPISRDEFLCARVLND